METTTKKENYLTAVKFERRLNIVFGVIIILAIAIMLSGIDNPTNFVWNKYFLKIKNLELIVLFTGVLFVTNIYKQFNNTADNLLYWTKFLKNGKLSLIVSAMFLGMMPVKGRTILSAPIIAEISRKNKLDNYSAGMVNYFSSHIYYLMFPLSTSLIFVIVAMNFNFFKFIFFLMPGIIFLSAVVWHYASKSGASDNFVIETKVSFKKATQFIIPIITLLFFLGLYGLYKVEYSILAGTVLFVVLTLISLKPNKNQIKNAWKSIDKYLIFVLALILLLSVLAKSSPLINSSLLEVIVSAYSIPVLIIIGYLIGFTIGSSSTMVSFIFPLLAPILIGTPFAYQIAAIVYASEYAGYIASPAHPCCHYTASFFNVPYLKIWWKITIYAAIASALNIIFALFFISVINS